MLISFIANYQIFLYSILNKIYSISQTRDVNVIREFRKKKSDNKNK
jgi:hypothetical protein